MLYSPHRPFHPARKALLAVVAVVLTVFTSSCTPTPDASPSAGNSPSAVGTAVGISAPAASESDPWRPAAHLTASQNWINDPNGLVYENGTYHAFYQHNPHGNFWGDMSWGHSTSTDLVHWTQQPVAMEGSASEEIFSGAIVPDTRNASGLGTAENPPLVALYTSSYGDGGALPKGSQAQSVAYSLDHGTSWTKYKGNPVLSLQPASNNFRDPKVTWYEPGKYWVMTTVVADAQVVKLFKSTDLLHWNFLSDFTGVGAQGGLWEVPELLQMDVDGGSGLKKWVMILSINPGGIAGGSGMQYFVGEFDGTRFMAEHAAKPGDPLTDSQWLDHGADFYAANTITSAPGGKPELLGWMGNWDYAQSLPSTPWRGSMAIPRQLSLVATGNRFELHSTIAPAAADALTDAKTSEVHGTNFTVTDSTDSLGGDFGSRTELIDAEMDVAGSAEAGIVLRASAGGKAGLRISYNRATQTLKVDRSAAGTSNFSPKFSPFNQASVPMKNGKVRLRILLDSSSVEVFTQDGSVVISDIFFPQWGNTGAAAFSSGGTAGFVLTSTRIQP
ncbi:glycoside hydrolase family 32 protein [Arthrobacter sp. MI7-26]|uniref:glycoside hydrolase family 32 protein n=1 Tax=Arthrobacter sp. MI7-26 TaxID=2993653 RepID=UPI0022491BCA|nr:glycoside hydrolase family 32 protein [Arthrobacter sp. MI7-26]MCX2749777.1 glycoside hydrolase family 32 protein [Arthrobacter sp. MI7-26]